MQVKFGEKEVRLQADYPEPFPLYPYEELHTSVTEVTFLGYHEALVIQCDRPFLDSRFGEPVQRFAEDKYILKGPGVYLPRIEESVQSKTYQKVIRNNEALHLIAEDNLVDSQGVKRIAGERWVYTQEGNYFP